MNKTAHNASKAKRISPATRYAMAMQAIGRQQTIADLSRHFDCGRMMAYQQKKRVLEAAVNAFEETDEEVLFTVSVTLSLPTNFFTTHSLNPHVIAFQGWLPLVWCSLKLGVFEPCPKSSRSAEAP